MRCMPLKRLYYGLRWRYLRYQYLSSNWYRLRIQETVTYPCHAMFAELLGAPLGSPFGKVAKGFAIGTVFLEPDLRIPVWIWKMPVVHGRMRTINHAVKAELHHVMVDWWHAHDMDRRR